jgi:uroporphyrinogen decarboxylase
MLHGDATFSIPPGNEMAQFCYRLVDEPEQLKAEAAARLTQSTGTRGVLSRAGGLDGFALCSDYCFKHRTLYCRPSQFAEFITPYLAQLNQA